MAITRGSGKTRGGGLVCDSKSIRSYIKHTNMSNHALNELIRQDSRSTSCSIPPTIENQTPRVDWSKKDPVKLMARMQRDLQELRGRASEIDHKIARTISVIQCCEVKLSEMSMQSSSDVADELDEFY